MVHDEIDTENLNFSDTIRTIRDHIGLRQYKVAKLLDITVNRLSRLETGFFRDIPLEQEIEKLAYFYEIPFEVLKAKALSQNVDL